MGGRLGQGWSAVEASKLVGVSYKQLDYWAHKDLLSPSIDQGRGSGGRRVYSYTDLLVLKVVERLVSAGVSPLSTRQAVECLRSSGYAWDGRLLIGDGHSVVVRSDKELLSEMVRGSGLGVVVDLGKVVSEVDGALRGE